MNPNFLDFEQPIADLQAKIDAWYRDTRPVVTDWIGRANRAGMRGQFLYDRMMLLIGANSGV